MKKIDNKFDNSTKGSIMARANLCVINQKQIIFTSTRKIKIFAFILISILTVIFLLFGSPFLVLANLSSFAAMFVSAKTLKMSAKEALKSMCNNMAWMANGYEELSQEYSDEVEVDIVPKNMKIGEDLEAINVIPIFKEGKYVIIKSFDHPCFIRVFEEEGKEEAYVMEQTDKDIEMLESDLPEYQAYIDVLKLQKTPPSLL